MKQLFGSTLAPLDLVFRFLAMAVLTEVGAVWLLVPGLPLSEQLLLRAVFILLLAVLLMPYPTQTGLPSARLQLLWMLASGAAVLPGLWWLGSVPTPTMFILAGGIAALVWFYASLAMALAGRLRDRRLASGICLGILLLGLGLPLWASPLASLYGGSKAFIDAIIALCPVSYIAALADIDFLRGQWFYQHTPYGSLRFDYPNTVYTTLSLLLSGSAVTALAGARQAHITSFTLKPLEIHS